MALALLTAGVQAARAEGTDFSDYEVEPWTTDIGQWGLKLEGRARGTVFGADQPNFAGLHETNVTGYAEIAPSLTRIYDNGMALSLNSKLNLWHDRLSGDSYDNDFFELAYAALQTGLGRIEIGMADGPAVQLAETGPVVLDELAIDSSNTSFFLDPTTGAAFIDSFSLNSPLNATLNYAKIAYYSPEVFGWKFGLAYTPSTAKNVIPFAFAAQKVADRQEDFWEAAVHYTGTKDKWTYAGYAAFVFGHNGAKTPGSAGLTDWGFGGQLDYALEEDVTVFSIGGSFRETNAYTLDAFAVGASGITQSIRASIGATHENWIAGLEYVNGRADRPGEDTLGIDGYGASVGYVFNSNLQLTAGWQSLRYRTDAAFYDGSSRIRMDAFYLTASFKVEDAW